MRRISILIGMAGLPLAATGAAAQIGCDDPAVSVSAAGAPLEGFAVLFQQNGVTFYGRAAATDGTPLARILIRNGNRFPVEVSYSVLLEYTADSLPRSLGLGRHCAQIPAGQFAIAEDAVPAPPSALRVRNLTIANLAAGQTTAGAPLILSPPGDAAPKGAPRPAPTATTAATGTPVTGRGPVNVAVPGARTPAARERVAVVPPAAPPAARQPSAAPQSTPKDTPKSTTAGRSQAAAVVVDTPDLPPASVVREATVARAASGPPRTPVQAARREELGPVRPASAGVGEWALEATHAVFFSLSAIVMVAAGLGLLLPVLAGFVLLAVLALGFLRRGAGRGAA